jgi:formate hydrogenlyase subunit 6/NADH:ubiquinone oxidoreductase subunit I
VADKWMPTIPEDQCTGCGLCVEACGPRSLAMMDGIVVLALPVIGRQAPKSGR